jgi:hypothetical protein
MNIFFYFSQYLIKQIIKLFNHKSMKQTLLLLLAVIGINAKAITAQPSITMTSAKDLNQSIQFLLAAVDDNTLVQIDFGNGTLIDKTIGTSNTSISGNLVGTKTVKIYGSGIKLLICPNLNLVTIDVTSNSDLVHLICSVNLLSSLDVTKNNNLEYLDCSNNQLSSLDVTYNGALRALYCFSNNLSSLNLTSNLMLTDLSCYYNKFNFVTLPQMTLTNYIYAPQQSITIAPSFAINSDINLSSQLTINGNTTTYNWKTESGTSLTAGTDYTISSGITKFKTIPTEKVYCEMTNETFNSLSGTKVLKTTLTNITNSTAAKDAKAGIVDIYTHHQTVYLSLPQAAMVQVYDITGHLVKAQFCSPGTNNFEVPQKGIFVVKVEMENQTETRKIVVR